MASTSGESNSGKNKGPTQEQIVQTFQDMRNQQKAVASKISELQMERKEHEMVLDALKEVDESRKCFRMVGGVLVERTVKEVLPAVSTNFEQLGKLIETLTKQLETKGKEINEYREKYKIRIQGEDKESQQQQKDSAKSSGVLVES